jgi:hypothetical protein
MTSVELIKAGIVLSGTNQAAEYTPAVDEVVIITKFSGKGNESSLADVRLYWDLGGAEEELLWVLDSGNMPREVWFTKTGNGTRKITLCLANGCSNDYAMSGYVYMESDL